MQKTHSLPACVLALMLALGSSYRAMSQDYTHESAADRNARMQWWREARFGLFIHWGLYSIPAGEWKGDTNHAEWIRTTAQIPLKEYDNFIHQFNPVKFNARQWVRAAREAGMKYIVITSKHHDGFCLFNTKYTDFNVMSTPFRRDILKEMSEACREEGLKMCWYHSIMDWHHPDYLPRRDWETDRPVEGADFRRYVGYLKNELKELLTNYGPIGVLWFDGEWESTWNSTYGTDLYNYVRSLQPQIIINNRVGAGRSGMEGFTKGGEFAGDFGTPEQEVPATGLPGTDWESCITMNDNWGYNKHDHHWKSPATLIRMLADIASKGGNFLLNIGPTSEGVFPPESLDRLREIGRWMKVNGDAIYGTQASPFAGLEWGRCTQKSIDGGTRLYLHVFSWPKDQRLVVPGILNSVKQAYLLSRPQDLRLAVTREADALVVRLPVEAPDAVNSIVVLDVAGKPDITAAPVITSAHPIFVDSLQITLRTDRENTEVRYTLDGTLPQPSSPLAQTPIWIKKTTRVTAQCYRSGTPVSDTTSARFMLVSPIPPVRMDRAASGIRFAYYEGKWDTLPDFAALAPAAEGVLPQMAISSHRQPDYFGFEFRGFIRVPRDGVYAFSTTSDDGSRLYIGDVLVVDNNGLHGMREAAGVIPLAAGLHPIRVGYFERTGGEGLEVAVQGPGMEKTIIPGELLFHAEDGMGNK